MAFSSARAPPVKTANCSSSLATLSTISVSEKFRYFRLEPPKVNHIHTKFVRRRHGSERRCISDAFRFGRLCYAEPNPNRQRVDAKWPSGRTATLGFQLREDRDAEHWIYRTFIRKRRNKVSGIVGYSKLSINEQHAAVEELNQVCKTCCQAVPFRALEPSPTRTAKRFMACREPSAVMKALRPITFPKAVKI